jgi:hypothetical protein
MVRSSRLFIAGSLVLAGVGLMACGDSEPEPGSAGGGQPPVAGADDGGDASGGAAAGTTAAGGAARAGGTATGGTTVGGTTMTGAGTGTGGSGSGGSLYLPCESAADCEPYGGGKVCCVAGEMHFCTKPSACSGKMLP